jgi:hypothetical protein
MVPSWRNPAMVLVQPIGFVQRVREHWLMQPLQICARIELAIRPLLRASNSRETIMREMVVHPFALPLSKDALRRQIGELRFGDTRPGRISLSRMETFATLDDVRTMIGNSSGLPEALAFKPLSLVLQRMSEPTAIVTTRDCGATAARRAFVVSDHVVARLQRSEEYIARPNLIPARPQPKIPTVETASPIPVAQAAEVFEAKSPRTRWKQPSAQPPAINVEALADQVLRRIDRRVVAWRERTGRR